MEYSEFVKTYFRFVVNRLNRFTIYKGKTEDASFDIPKDVLIDIERVCPFLPKQDLKEDAAVDYYEKYIVYMGKRYIDLRVIFCSKQQLKELYQQCTTINRGDDEKLIKYIKMYLNAGFDNLKLAGIIA